MSSDLLSPGAFWNYYTYYSATGKKVENKNSSSANLPAIIQFHQGLINDINNVGRSSFATPFFTTPYNACVITPVNCTNDMAGYTIPLDNIRKSDTLSYAKTGVSPIPNYYDVKYKDDNPDQGDDFNGSDDELRGCAAQRNFCETDSSALHYIVYSPMNVDYTNCKLPGIILFHAGGYSDCSNYKYEDSLCYALARKAFIVYLVEYRRGRIKDTVNGGGQYTSVQQMLALYRAFQDGRGAIRSIIKRQRNIASNHLPYQLDTNNIFVAGQSAGATIANSLAYYKTQTKIDAIFPVPPGYPSFQSALGPIDADFYYGTTDIEYQSKIKGLWSMWGGFGIPTDINGVSADIYNFLTDNGTDAALVPMIGVMGRKDQVFPYLPTKQFISYPPDSVTHQNFTTQYLCLLSSSFKIYTELPPKNAFRIACTNDMYNMLKAHGKATLQYIDCKMAHGLTKINGTDLCPSDFGAPGINLTLNQVNEYLASKACFFFQYILSGTTIALGGASKFTDCLDKRHSHGTCVTDEDNDGCTDEKTCN